MRPIRSLLPILLLALLPVLPAAAQEDKAKEKDVKPPEEKVSTTRHTITLDGQALAYTATAGNMILKDEEGNAKASVFYIAYTKDGVKDPARRPVTFSFNGGPGAASLWVHLGAFGPRRVERTPEGMALPPPGRLVDNENSILDVTDLVFIDPVSTGYSRPAPGQNAAQFHGLVPDVEWVAELIRLWVTRNERWASPKLIAGESYGTTRAAGLAQFLAERYGMMLNGVVLISTILNWQDQEFNVGNDIPFMLHLPTYAATAWYHKKLPPELQGDLRKTLDEVEAFARGEYALALLQGDRLSPEKRREVAAKLARYTGLSPEYVERTNLRIGLSRFTKELLRDQGKTVGRLDTRFTGSDLDSAGEEPEYDPAWVSTDGPFTAMINDYLRRELGYKEDRPYERMAEVKPWSFAGFENKYANLAESLRVAMTANPDMKVLFTSGYYDLATPYFDSVYTADHLGLAEPLRKNVRMAFYESGHMIYIRAADHAKLRQEVEAFIREAVGK
jgi:carboxypeptidase C (cathepsin A)